MADDKNRDRTNIMAFTDALAAHVSGDRRPEIYGMSPSGLRWWVSAACQAARTDEKVARSLRMVAMKMTDPALVAELPEVHDVICRHITEIFADDNSTVMPDDGSSCNNDGKKKRRRAVSAKRIISAVAMVARVHVEDIKGRTRVRHVVEARHAAAYLIHRALQRSLTETARFLGRRSHTTIINSLREAQHNAGVALLICRAARALGLDEEQIMDDLGHEVHGYGDERRQPLPVWRVMWRGLPMHEIVANTPDAAVWASQLQMVNDGVIKPGQAVPLHGVYAREWR